MKKMNKLVFLLLALAICASLAACGGSDKRSAVDAFNKAKAAFNEVSAIINQDIEAYDEDFVDTMIEWSGVLNEMKDMLDSNSLDQDALDEVTAYCEAVEQWSVETKAILESE